MSNPAEKIENNPQRFDKIRQALNQGVKAMLREIVPGEKYTVRDVSEITGRSRSRIHQIINELDCGEVTSVYGMQYHLLGYENVLRIVEYLSKKGQPRTDRARDFKSTHAPKNVAPSIS